MVKKKKVIRTRYKYANILPISVRNKEIISEERPYVKEYLLKKLKDNWLILKGDIDTVSGIEKSIFKPSTGANDDFAMIIGDKNELFLAKKTSALRIKIMNYSNIDEGDYDRLIMLDFIAMKKLGKKEVLLDVVVRGRSNREIEEQKLKKEYGDDIKDNRNYDADLDEFYNDFVEDILVHILNMGQSSDEDKRIVVQGCENNESGN